ncbi:DivIVA domain-containing protein [Fulvivirga sp. RKSG066]|uniref:DivIVA domain-containing protein n=1 Tax=Fulvivirga aurantia TaxID=2529383 RepID=UPI0012BCD684|nr:DivIVA domain-containing protein [Fulvivirga aurantia]MTI21088.1 DivIVA domain-containing protein [Fulvivirga aurantia]
MKITPLEIRQKTFEKAFRGLDKDEVNAFLVTLSQEWEKLIDENKELKIKLEASQKEVEKLREVENSLFKTLKTAEDTGASMIDQATKTAELHMKETQMKAEALMNDAKSKAKDTIEEAEMKSRNTLDDMEDRIRSMAQVYRTLENVKADLLSDIKSFASDALDKVERVKMQMKSFDVEDELMRIKRESIQQNTSTRFDVESHNTPAPPPISEESPRVNENQPSQKKNEESTSFFDDIE